MMLTLCSFPNPCSAVSTLHVAHTLRSSVSAVLTLHLTYLYLIESRGSQQKPFLRSRALLKHDLPQQQTTDI